MTILDSIRITSIANIRTITQTAAHKTTVRDRAHWGLSFCQQGRIIYTANGREYISDPGHAILHPKGVTYDLQVERPGQFCLINFDCTGLEGCEFLSSPLRNPESYLKQFSQLQQLWLFHKDDLKLLGLFYELLSQLSRELLGDDGQLHGILAYMEDHISDPSLSNTSLARQAGFSEVYFRRLFANAYGMPPRQYLLNLRLKKAMQLLADSPLSVTAISELCGFSSLYHFSRCFTERTGMRPTEYAKRHKPGKI